MIPGSLSALATWNRGTPFEIIAGGVWREGHGDLLYWEGGEWVLEWSGKNCAEVVLREVCVESRGRGIGPDHCVGKVLKEGGSDHSLPSGATVPAYPHFTKHLRGCILAEITGQDCLHSPRPREWVRATVRHTPLQWDQEGLSKFRTAAAGRPQAGSACGPGLVCVRVERAG